ncbi:MAG TPA: YciI family protein, partial [Trebonia sp.]|nr:YciI family protein [Trebonia sp.]
ELVGGFWIWQVSSMDEAVEWLKRAPFKGTSVELRRVAEAADFEGQLPQDVIDAEQRLRNQTGQQG